MWIWRQITFYFRGMDISLERVHWGVLVGIALFAGVLFGEHERADPALDEELSHGHAWVDHQNGDVTFGLWGVDHSVRCADPHCE